MISTANMYRNTVFYNSFWPLHLNSTPATSEGLLNSTMTTTRVFWHLPPPSRLRLLDLPPLPTMTLSPDFWFLEFEDEDLLFFFFFLMSTNWRSKNGVVHRKVSRGDLTWTHPSAALGWAAIDINRQQLIAESSLFFHEIIFHWH